MAKFPLVRGFKDPVTRPRYIIWTGVAVLLLASVVICALGVTSTYWFCAEGCHKVQDDSIAAYDASSHSRISCMACHMPVNADPVTFVLHKAKALGELYLTVTNKFELPLNPHSHLSQSHEMTSEQCTQCHNLETRKVTPGPGIIIDHKKHEEAKVVAAAEEEYANEIHCTWCHNRIAHDEEEAPPALKHPATGEENHPHENFMEMSACFRCHTLTDESYSEQWKAPGACAKCHPKGFDLKPANHDEKGFYPAGHAEMAKEEKEHNAEVATEYEHLAAEGDHFPLPPVGEVFYCGTCHVENKFCLNCHGMEMPHPTEFKEKTHPELVKTKADKCTLCHAPAKTFFCDECHHGKKSNWEFDKKAPWRTQHAKAVTKNGVKGCLGTCHEAKFCLDCHKTLKAAPSSHSAGNWLRKPDAELGVHAANFKAEPSACEICHGPDEPNRNTFCFGCHKYELPHPEEFKKFHSATGKKTPANCQYCHTYREVCSNCHHEGASLTVAWATVHGGLVNKSGAGSCLEKCHKADFCVACHTARKVVPASHKPGNWTRDASAKQALHAGTFQKQPASCEYCHGKNAPNKNTFCRGCHKVDMPHPDGFGPGEGVKPARDKGGQHAEALAKKQMTAAMCNTCHTTAFCNSCHHAYAGKQPWVNYHPNTVKKSGAAGCLQDGCHEETFCSYCHVRRAHEFIKK